MIMSTAQQQGLVAILDALGAASYTDSELQQFLQTRKLVLQLLRKKVREGSVTTFTFNDTVLIVCRTADTPTVEDVHFFCELLRRFEINSLNGGILFRGAFAIGTFYVDDLSNTVMGEAVTDAAAWYDSADWIGINATPKAAWIIDSLRGQAKRKMPAVLVDYDVPLRGAETLATKAINWPKAFVVRGLRPLLDGSPREVLLQLLTAGRIPKGTESKYHNAIKFFDFCLKRWRENKRANAEAPPGVIEDLGIETSPSSASAEQS